MLYDILVIDDVLDESYVTSESTLSVPADGDIQTTQHFEQQLDAINIRQFILQLIKENLRVTWTTGEFEDMQQFTTKDLYTIRYIFLDLDLEGETRSLPKYQVLNSNLMGIFQAIDAHISSPKVTCYINSKNFQEEEYGDAGKNDLQDKLKQEFSDRYTVEVIAQKNSLSDNQKNELRMHNVRVYTKDLIINKIIEVEAIFDVLLRLSSKAIKDLTFQHKYLVFQSQYLGKTSPHKQIKHEISLLQKIRNKLAHTDGDLSGISDKDEGGVLRKTFWSIVAQKDSTDDIEFKNFDSLMKYVASIDTLCKTLNQLAST